MNEVAIASGFGSVRRFNAAILKVYHRTPSQIRRLARKTGLRSGDQYQFRLNFRPPYHWQAMLDFLAPRATPGVEVVADSVYSRTISLNGIDGLFEVSLDGAQDALLVRIDFPDPRALFVIVERIRALFDLNADWTSIAKTLRGDRVLGPSVKAEPGIRVAGCWSGFELAVRAILGQQVTVRGATSLAGRMVAAFGRKFDGPAGLSHTFPAADVLAKSKLEGIGLTGARAETIRSLARAVAGGQIKFEGVIDSNDFLRRLCEIPGIGPWTAQYVAMRALREPDAFPSSDLGLLRASAVHTPQDLEQHSAPWRPWRAYAAMYLWRMGGMSRAAGRPGRKSVEGSRPEISDLEQVAL